MYINTMKKTKKKRPSDSDSKLSYMIGSYAGNPIPQEYMDRYSEEDIAKYKKLAPKLRAVLAKYNMIVNDPLFVAWKKADAWLSGRSGY